MCSYASFYAFWLDCLHLVILAYILLQFELINPVFLILALLDGYGKNLDLEIVTHCNWKL